MFLFRCIFFVFAHSWVRIQFKLETWGWMKKPTIVSMSFLCDPKIIWIVFVAFGIFWMLQQFSKKKIVEMQRKSMPCSCCSIAFLFSPFCSLFISIFIFQKNIFFRWFVYLSAKPITCLYIFGWMRELCWSIGWLVCWSVDGLCVCSFSLSL